MADPNLVAQARQGNVMAIAALMNRSLQSQGIWGRVEQREATLHVELESAQVPDQAALSKRLVSGIRRLSPPGIQQVVISGFALGETAPAWEQTISLANGAAASPAASRQTAPEAISQPGPEASAQSSFPQSAVANPSPDAHVRQLNDRLSRSKKQRSRPVAPGGRARPPVVIRWSDFDPLKATVILLVAVYGFFGCLNPGLDGPFIWLHYPDLAIHETGHLLFMPFGRFLRILGGSLTQILFPAVFTAYFFWSKQRFASALTLFWTGQNFMDVAVYVRDAPVRLLPLTVDNPDAHDWYNLLRMVNCLQCADELGNVLHGIGVGLYLVAVAAGLYFARDRHQAH